MSVFSIIALVLGIIICIAGLIYLVKDHSDAESVKIYGVIAIVGAVIAILGGTGVIG